MSFFGERWVDVEDESSGFSKFGLAVVLAREVRRLTEAQCGPTIADAAECKLLQK